MVETVFRRLLLPLVRGSGHQVSSPSPKRASGGQGANAVACHSCAVCRHGVLRHHQDGVNQLRGHAGEPGAMTTGDHAPWGVVPVSRRLQDGLGADGAVPKAVVDEGDDPSCHGDAGDLASTGAVAVVGGDANKVGSQLGPIRLALRRLDRCPANKTRSLFSDRAPMHRQVRLAVLRVSPAQLASWAGDRNLVTSPISATNTEANNGPIPGICWIAW